MKKLLFIFISIIFLFNISLAYAQQEKLFLITTPFNTREDLDTLFANSTRVLKYIEENNGADKTFLSIINQNQKNTLEGKNFTLTVIEEYPDIDRYVLLWSPELNQANKVSFVEKVNQITPHYVLIKLLPNTTIADVKSAANFLPAPFSPIVVLPPTIQPTHTPLPTIVISPTIAMKSSNNLLNMILLIAGIIFVLLTIIGIIIFLKKKRSSEDNLPPPPSYTPPQQPIA